MSSSPPMLLWHMILYGTAIIYLIIVFRVLKVGFLFVNTAHLETPKPWKFYTIAGYIFILSLRRLLAAADGTACPTPWLMFWCDVFTVPVIIMVVIAVESLTRRTLTWVDSLERDNTNLRNRISNSGRRDGESTMDWVERVGQELSVLTTEERGSASNGHRGHAR